MMDPLQSVYSQTVFGLYGDQRSLVLNTLCVHRPTSIPSDPNAAQPLNAIHGDLKTVAYFVVGSTGGVSSAPAGGQSTPGAATSGLARLEGDHLAIGYAMQQATTLTSAARVIAPEVTMITFRYFDGTQWLPSWDSSYLQALPKAVECTIAVAAPNTGGSGSLPSLAAQSQARLYRHVVAISTMAPPVPISELTTTTGTTP
jgi:hypothetical protein